MRTNTIGLSTLSDCCRRYLAKYSLARLASALGVAPMAADDEDESVADTDAMCEYIVDVGETLTHSFHDKKRR